MQQESLVTHKKFLNLLPEINQAKAYGQATKLIRQNLDKHFGKPAEDTKKTYVVNVRCESVEYHDYLIEAWSQLEAEEEALERAERDGDYTDIEISQIREK